MIQITSSYDCCGCTACASVCNRNAIIMEPDALGFLYPRVDVNKCTNCGLCERVCSFNEKYDVSLNFQNPIAYGARHKSLDEVMESRSGAVFVALSDYVLAHGGVIYGAALNDNFEVIHKCAVSKAERNEFRGSKYVQSNLNNVFRQVKKDLQLGKYVLFSGTPCQTSGLASFIGKKLRENLLLVDIICHGVAEPYIWRDYVNYLKNKYGESLFNVDFRDKKRFGWNSHVAVFKFSKIVIDKWFSPNYYHNLMLRNSCGNCHFCNTHRPSDITLGDFWGWEKTGSDINKDNKGLNLVLINTEKGKCLFELIKENLFIIDATPDMYLQPNLQCPSKFSRNRLKFEKDYKEKGFDYIYSRDYNKRSIMQKIKCKINNFLIGFANK